MQRSLSGNLRTIEGWPASGGIRFGSGAGKAELQFLRSLYLSLVLGLIVSDGYTTEHDIEVDGELRSLVDILPEVVQDGVHVLYSESSIDDPDAPVSLQSHGWELTALDTLDAAATHQKEVG